MLTRRQQNKSGRVNFVVEARAGLIPESDDLADEKQARMNYAAHVIREAKACLGSVGRVSDDHAIINILADLRHYCGHKDLGFDKLARAACTLYMEQRADGVG